MVLVIVGRQLNYDPQIMILNYDPLRPICVTEALPELFQWLIRSSWIGIVKKVIVDVANNEVSIFRVFDF